MSFPVKNWQNKPSTETPLTAEALEDLEARLSTYTDQEVETVELTPGEQGPQGDTGPQGPQGDPSESLAYAEITSDSADSTSIVEVDISGLAITFVAPDVPFWLEAQAISYLASAASARVINFYITSSGNSQLDLCPLYLPGTATYGKVRASRRISTATPGNTYTFKVRQGISAAGTHRILAAATWPAYIRAFTE